MSCFNVSTASPSCSHGAVPPCEAGTHHGRLDTARRLQQLICLASVVALATASGQAPTWNPHSNRPLEKYDNPPAYIYRLESSPRKISPYGAFISYQVNVDANGNNIVGDAANECTISVDPTNTSKMAIGWRMKQERSSTLACSRHFVKTCTGQRTVANPGQSCKPTASRVEAIRSGLR